MPRGIKTLAEGSFKGAGLEIFLISSNITTLQEDCFDVQNLKAVKIAHKNLNQLNYTESCFANVSDVDLYVPEGCADLYKEFYPWKNFKSVTEYIDEDDEFQYNAYKVSFIVEDGDNITRAKSSSMSSVDNSLFNKDYFASGVAIENVPAPHKDGYIFTGWDNMPDIMPANDLVVKAIYEVDHAAVLANAKESAKQELASYKDQNEYREAQQIELANAIEIGNNAIDASITMDEVNIALANAKSYMDAIKTNSQLMEEEVAIEVSKFKSDYADILAKTIETVSVEDNDAIVAALTSYSVLTEMAQVQLQSEQEHLNALKQRIEESVSGIDTVITDLHHGCISTLSGHKVQTVQMEGVYIVNGRKTLIK
jgi:hypothetical protein